MKIFLFPHQDDEFGAFYAIDRAVADGDLLVVYLTDGAYGGTSAQTRRAESQAVLHRLGVRDEQIGFWANSWESPTSAFAITLRGCCRLLMQVSLTAR